MASKKKLKKKIKKLKRLIIRAIPFVGYGAYVPDIVKRLEKASDYKDYLKARENR